MKEKACFAKYPENMSKVIIVGRLDKEKRHDRLLHIWKKVIKELPAAKLDIVGDGSERQNLIKIVYQLGLNESVSFLGFREDISGLLRKSNISVLTSDFEGFGLVVIESFLQKRPVIAFDIFSLKEIFSNNCGILVKSFDIDEFAEKIVYLLKNPIISKEMGENGYQRVLNHFNIDRMIEQIETKYLEVLNI